MAEKYSIKIPNNISIIYSNKKKVIIFKGPLAKKSLKLYIQLLLIKPKNTIKVSLLPFYKISKNKQKKKKFFQGTTTALIKQLIIETSAIIYQRLKFVGVGYRAFDLDTFKKKLLLFKLGYSHFLYFKVTKNFKIFCLKMTKLFVYGSSYQNVTQIASSIRSYKKPEPYKNKGILYDIEKVVLKEGKKA